MTVTRSNIELKREYYAQSGMLFTPQMIERLVKEYGDRPVTTGEAVYILHERVKDLLSVLPIIGRYVR